MSEEKEKTLKKIKKIKNLTPHEVRIVGERGKEISSFPSQGVIRLAEKREKIGDVNGIPIFRKRFGGSDLPPEREGIYYIVSLPVAQAFPERKDFLVPDQLVRDNQGRVIGARSFAVFSGGE